MLVSSIVACANNRIIGKNNEIPWYLPADLQYFKKVTLNHAVIMGRNCYESIGRPLPKRTNIIVTRNPFYIASGCLIAHSIEEALQLAADQGETEAFIIGGGHIYAQSVDYWGKLYLTVVDLDTEGDVFFPDIDMTEWELAQAEPHLADAKNPFPYTFYVYERKNDITN